MFLDLNYLFIFKFRSIGSQGLLNFGVLAACKDIDIEIQFFNSSEFSDEAF
jgi:hypothetical protein